MTWVIKLAPPEATIVRDTTYTGIVINDVTRAPGEYKVRKGTWIYAKARIQNTGGKTGDLWVAVYDELTGNILVSEVAHDIAPGAYVDFKGLMFQVNQDLNVDIIAGVGSVPGQNKTDSWGCAHFVKAARNLRRLY